MLVGVLANMATGECPKSDQPLTEEGGSRQRWFIENAAYIPERGSARPQAAGGIATPGLRDAAELRIGKTPCDRDSRRRIVMLTNLTTCECPRSDRSLVPRRSTARYPV